jgi:hypothetical protein
LWKFGHETQAFVEQYQSAEITFRNLLLVQDFDNGCHHTSLIEGRYRIRLKVFVNEDTQLLSRPHDFSGSSPFAPF